MTLFLFIFFSCNESENTFILEGFTDLDDDVVIYRVAPNSVNQPIKMDSTIVRNGVFNFSSDVKEIDVNFLNIKGKDTNIPFILESGRIDVNIFNDSLDSSQVRGSKSNNDLNLYRSKTKSIVNSLNKIVNEIQIANSLGDNLLVEDLQNQYRAKQTELLNFEIDLAKNMTDSYLSVLMLEKLINQKTIDIKSAKEITSAYSPQILNSRVGKILIEKVNAPIDVTSIGEIAPNFEGPSPSGEILSLSNLKGKVTIIEFWASWCRPCRVENPNLVRLYKEMHPKGLEIVGVSLDRNRNSWLRAIDDDGLTWSHVSNLKFWQDPIAKLYNISAIPASFIIDKEGRIIQKNLRGPQLAAKISELLSN
tara:strand:- start:252 stop:1343 length:1092 start_codon:yes stop_codon:yes gene_type:complete